VAFAHRPHIEAEDRREFETDEARQADDDRESFRVLDASLVLVIVAFAILGLYFATVAVS